MGQIEDNKGAFTPVSVDRDEAQLIQPIPQNKRQKRLAARPEVRRFTIVEQLGFNPFLHCWCGVPPLELDYSEGDKAMTTRLSCFLDIHEQCEAKQK